MMPTRHEDDEGIDPNVHCSRCDAVCCRLTVMVLPEDRVPRALVALDDYGSEVMGRSEEGWCIALDHRRMRCTIYALRPSACRDFAMGDASCRDERKAYLSHYPGLPLILSA